MFINKSGTQAKLGYPKANPEPYLKSMRIAKLKPIPSQFEPAQPKFHFWSGWPYGFRFGLTQAASLTTTPPSNTHPYTDTHIHTLS